jgi:hypothetical protein
MLPQMAADTWEAQRVRTKYPSAAMTVKDFPAGLKTFPPLRQEQKQILRLRLRMTIHKQDDKTEADPSPAAQDDNTEAG